MGKAQLGSSPMAHVELAEDPFPRHRFSRHTDTSKAAKLEPREVVRMEDSDSGESFIAF